MKTKSKYEHKVVIEARAFGPLNSPVSDAEQQRLRDEAFVLAKRLFDAYDFHVYRTASDLYTCSFCGYQTDFKDDACCDAEFAEMKARGITK